GYRTDFGPNVTLRFRFKNLHAGAAYDFPSNRFGGSTGGTQEIQMKFQFGKTLTALVLDQSDSTIQTVAHVDEMAEEQPLDEVPPIEADETEPVIQQQPIAGTS